MPTAQQHLQHYWEYIPKKQRDAIPDEDFAGPGRTFPCDTQDHLDSCAKLLGHAADPATVKAKAIKIAKRKGLTLPKSWQDEEQPKEAATAPIAVQPLGIPLAVIKVCWLEDGGVSLNRRQYPKETVDRMIQRAQVDLSNPNALPLTCYLSHEAADHDKTLDLVGRIIRVWREGSKAMAAIAIAATDAGRNLITLIEGGFIKSISLRGENCEMDWSQGDIPQVRGSNVCLAGIDFTTTPGLAEIARIEGFLTESQQGVYCDAFLALSQEASMPQQIKEGTIPPMASGVTVGVDGSPGSDYAYPAPSVQDLSQNPVALGGASISAHQATHDHLAAVLDEALASIHTRENATPAMLNEAGRKIAVASMKRLVAAHDEAAKALGMACEGGYNKHLNPDTPGNNDDNLEANMTPEQAKALLEQAGYTVDPPKTAEQLLEEKVAALVEQKMRSLQPQQQGTTMPPQRTSLVEGAQSAGQPKRPYYRPGDYFKEQLRTVDARELLDRSRPLPDWMQVERAIKEYSTVMLGLYDQRFGLD